MLPETIGIVGINGPLGRAVVAALDSTNFAGTVVGIDTAEPDDETDWPAFVAAVKVPNAAAVGDAAAGCDVVVNLGLGDQGGGDPAEGAGAGADSVEVAMAIIDALHADAGPSGFEGPRFVLLSSARVYGAYPNNPVPLSEDSPLRPNEGARAAGNLAEIERRLLVAGNEDRTPTFAVLRAATIFGPGVDPRGVATILEPETVAAAGERPFVQYIHTDDVAAAIVHVVEFGLKGVYNAAPAGWLTAEEVDSIARRKAPLLRLRPDEYRRWVAWRHRHHRALRNPEEIPYHSYPWVVSTARFAATGFRPRRSNAEALRVGLDIADKWHDQRTSRGRTMAKTAGAAALVSVALWLRHRAR